MDKHQKVAELMSLSRKKIFVSGAAGRLGVGTVRHLLQLGAIVIAGVNRETDEALFLSGSDAEPTALHVEEVDVSSQEQILSLEEEIRSRFGSLDGLVNLAARSVPANSPEISPQDFMRTFEINCLGSLLQVLMAERLMTGGGSVVLISSIYGAFAPQFDVYPGQLKPNSVDYGMSKAAVEQLTKYEAVRLAKKKIRVNAVRLGPSLGPGEALEREFQDAIARKIPMGHWGSAEDLANLVAFLLREESNFMTGSVISLDGGWTAQ